MKSYVISTVYENIKIVLILFEAMVSSGRYVYSTIKRPYFDTLFSENSVFL